MTTIRRSTTTTPPRLEPARTEAARAESRSPPRPSKTVQDAFAHSPANAQLVDEAGTRAFPGYKWAAKDVDAVMARHAIGDARQLLQTAIALDNGDRTLSLQEVAAAAERLTAKRNKDLKWSPGMLADIMTRRGVASETALLAEARRQDDGDKSLSRAELESAADVLIKTLAPHDVAGVAARVNELARKHGLEVTELGKIEAYPIQAVRFPSSGPTKMRVLVTAGVHGNEPCGPGAAMLLMEQLLRNPAIRKDTEFVVVPMVNPRGMIDHTRRTPEGVDLNRTFSHDEHAPEEVKLVGKLLASEQKFDLSLDLHSGVANRNGFWALHRDSLDLMQPAVDRFMKHWPVLSGDISRYHMTHPGIGESTNPNTLKDFAAQHGAKWSVTLEAPGSVGYLDQVFGQNDLANQIIVEAHRRVSGSAPAIA